MVRSTLGSHAMKASRKRRSAGDEKYKPTTDRSNDVYLHQWYAAAKHSLIITLLVKGSLKAESKDLAFSGVLALLRPENLVMSHDILN